VCGDVFDNPYKIGGDREGLEEMDSLGGASVGEHVDVNVCNDCYVKDPDKGLVRNKEN